MMCHSIFENDGLRRTSVSRRSGKREQLRCLLGMRLLFIITNVLPGHAQQAPTPDTQHGSIILAPPSNTASAQRLGIQGLRDDKVREYTEWQKSQVRDPRYKEAFDIAREAALKAGYDLDYIYEKQDVQFFIEERVLPGIAWSFCRDIYAWSQLK